MPILLEVWGHQHIYYYLSSLFGGGLQIDLIVFGITMLNYFEMINLKTSYMFGMSSELGALASGASLEITKKIRKFGLLMLLQI